jgi:cytochrome c2
LTGLKFLRFTAGILLIFLAGCSALVPPATPTLSPQEMRGQNVFDSYCSRCHSTNTDSIVVGPSLAGIASRGGSRREGMDTEAYIRDSIMSPDAYTVDGYPEGTMPSTLNDELSKEEMEAVIAYLLTLR